MNKTDPNWHKISGVIVCTNEKDLIANAMENIYRHVYELIVLDNNCLDGSSEIIKSFPDPAQKIRIVRIPFFEKLNFTIGGTKNFACELVTCPWTLVLDPDEWIEDKFFEEVHGYISKFSFDVIAFPRKNYIDGKLSDAYPDWQLRFRRSYCRYIHSSHHELVGWRRRYDLPTEDGYHIIHEKTASRQLFQDNRYDSWDMKFAHFEREEFEAF